MADGKTEQPAQEHLGRYRLIRKLARGGMAEVFLARSYGAHGFEKNVAIKRILPKYGRDPQFIRMMIDEARISVLLNHPNVAQILEFAEHEQDYFIVMEYVPGQSLSSLIKRLREQGEKLGLLESVFIVVQTLQGLYAAHSQKDSMGHAANIIHRDVSPQNVLLSYDGHVKVIDFGIARAKDRLEATEAGTIKGKLRYLAPEMIDPVRFSHHGDFDHRVDIFAAGVILYELISGRPLFSATEESEVYEMITEGDIPELSRQGLCDPILSKIVQRAIERYPEERYATAEEFSDELRAYLYRNDPSFTSKRVAQLLQKIFQPEYEKQQKLEWQLASQGAAEAEAKREEQKETLNKNSIAQQTAPSSKRKLVQKEEASEVITSPENTRSRRKKSKELPVNVSTSSKKSPVGRQTSLDYKQPADEALTPLETREEGFQETVHSKEMDMGGVLTTHTLVSRLPSLPQEKEHSALARPDEETRTSFVDRALFSKGTGSSVSKDRTDEGYGEQHVTDVDQPPLTQSTGLHGADQKRPLWQYVLWTLFVLSAVIGVIGFVWWQNNHVSINDEKVVTDVPIVSSPPPVDSQRVIETDPSLDASVLVGTNENTIVAPAPATQLVSIVNLPSHIDLFINGIPASEITVVTTGEVQLVEFKQKGTGVLLLSKSLIPEGKQSFVIDVSSLLSASSATVSSPIGNPVSSTLVEKVDHSLTNPSKNTSSSASTKVDKQSKTIVKASSTQTNEHTSRVDAGKKAFLMIKTSPYWAEVRIDGKLQEDTTPMSVDVTSGKHLIEVSHPPKGLTKKIKVTLSPGQSKTLSLTFE
jgi:serine/threonine protein kinase